MKTLFYSQVQLLQLLSRWNNDIPYLKDTKNFTDSLSQCFNYTNIISALVTNVFLKIEIRLKKNKEFYSWWCLYTKISSKVLTGFRLQLFWAIWKKLFDFKQSLKLKLFPSNHNFPYAKYFVGLQLCLFLSTIITGQIYASLYKNRLVFTIYAHR